MLSLGISLKLYFSHARTLEWSRDVAALASHAAIEGGHAELFVLPSFPSIPAVAEIFAGTPIRVGSQDLSAEDGGAFTGEVGGPLLRELGCTYAEVGHAERRRRHGEGDAIVAAKTKAALRNDLVPVLCVGEPDRVPSADAAEHCAAEVESALGGSPGPVLVAYEPHWAIGAARPAPESHITEVCGTLKDRLGVRVIYGGSAGPGLLTRLGTSVDGLFLGRFAHDPAAVGKVLDEALALAKGP
ncbi:triose-phosphate isomerase [Prauserella marina]|uniref:Triosephosphate isomerase n=1 Tax=Prauserella marina TaxID=530584 RepID=A0A222VPI3_9PSEU|nr:triose-phosphate isomerase family protein [Prauserella marina]ASR35835.1 triose-phosphate isomerase [Prauserella marina]PWV84253.1 triosephosphate isomerase [Prauserella marina]SDC26966.1 triosephosphate isomerase (TIM) [Prauserella marina]